MGTKNNPGRFDCYANAEPDEPMFVLLGRDPDARVLVTIWALMRAARNERAEKVSEAFKCADDMNVWLTKIGKRPTRLKEVQDVVRVTCEE